MKSMIGALAACALALAGCGDNLPDRGVCGDFVCDSSETASSCAADCGFGNGIANPGEDCPLGTMPDNDWKKMLKTGWRTDAGPRSRV